MTATEIAPDSTTVEGAPRARAKERVYWLVALVLGILTTLEVSTYTHPEVWDDAAVPSLLFFMAVKFFLVTWFFMHLKGDFVRGHRILTYLFYFGLVLALAVYLATIAAMHFFD